MSNPSAGELYRWISTKLSMNSILADSLVEMGESLRQMADVKYSLDDNIKQNFLEPLHHLQTKDLKEVMVSAVHARFHLNRPLRCHIRL